MFTGGSCVHAGHSKGWLHVCEELQKVIKHATETSTQLLLLFVLAHLLEVCPQEPSVVTIQPQMY